MKTLSERIESKKEKKAARKQAKAEKKEKHLATLKRTEEIGKVWIHDFSVKGIINYFRTGFSKLFSIKF